MMPQCGSGMPSDGEPSGHDSHVCTVWDVAYVLGSLSRADWLEFEPHMRGCVSCREAAAQLSGIPALLSQLAHPQVAAINEGADASAAPRPSEVLTVLLATVAWRRHWSHLVTATTARRWRWCFVRPTLRWRTRASRRRSRSPRPDTTRQADNLVADLRRFSAPVNGGHGWLCREFLCGAAPKHAPRRRRRLVRRAGWAAGTRRAC